MYSISGVEVELWVAGAGDWVAFGECVTPLPIGVGEIAGIMGALLQAERTPIMKIIVVKNIVLFMGIGYRLRRGVSNRHEISQKGFFLLTQIIKPTPIPFSFRRKTILFRRAAIE